MVVFHNRGVLHSVVGAFTVRPRPLILIPRPFFLNPADRFASSPLDHQEDQVRVFHQCNLAGSSGVSPFL